MRKPVTFAWITQRCCAFFMFLLYAFFSILVVESNRNVKINSVHSFRAKWFVYEMSADDSYSTPSIRLLPLFNEIAREENKYRWLNQVSHTHTHSLTNNIKRMTKSNRTTHYAYDTCIEWTTLNQHRDLYFCFYHIISLFFFIKIFAILRVYDQMVYQRCLCLWYDFFPFLCNWTQNDYGDCIPMAIPKQFPFALSFAIDFNHFEPCWL